MLSSFLQNGKVKTIMIEAYSKNVTVSSGDLIPLRTAFEKGCSTKMSGGASVSLAKCGVYNVFVNASGIASEGGLMTLQLMVNGSASPNAFATETAGDTTSTHALSFMTKVQVPANYKADCPCSAPFLVSLANTGVGATYSLVNVVIEKVI